jgi:hypothetical protein
MRRDDWPARLTEYVDAHRMTPFGWGSHDCVLFAAGWVLEATGVDPIGDIRDQWADERSALRLIKSLGGLRFAVDERLGNPISTALAWRGDLILHEITERPGLGICLGAEFAAPTEDGGLSFVPMSAARMAWRV